MLQIALKTKSNIHPVS